MAPLGPGAPQRDGGDPADTDPGVGDRAVLQRHLHGDPGHGEVTAAPAHFAERGPGAWPGGREADGGKQLVRPERGGQVCLVEVGGRDLPAAAGARGHEGGVQRDRHRWQLGGRVRVGQAAADRPPGADGRVGDPREGGGKQRAAGADRR